MTVVSPFIYYPPGSNSAYDLRKVLSWHMDVNDAAFVRFVGESSGASIVVEFTDGLDFEIAMQNSTDYDSGGGRYVQPTAMPFTVGGWAAGSTFPAPGKTMQEMWDGLLYPYLYPSFTSFSISGQSSPIEVGYTIPAAVTFTWGTTYPANVVVNSIDIQNFTDGIPLATGIPNDGSEAVLMPGPIQRLTAGGKTFRISGQNSLLGFFTRNLTFSWQWRTHYGQNTNPTLSEAQITALASNFLATAIAGTYVYGTTGFKYICVANSIGGQINTVKDSLTLLNVPLATVADDPAYSNVDGGGFSYALVGVTNAFGVSDSYRVYRTKNQLGAAITLLVT